MPSLRPELITSVLFFSSLSKKSSLSDKASGTLSDGKISIKMPLLYGRAHFFSDSNKDVVLLFLNFARKSFAVGSVYLFCKK